MTTIMTNIDTCPHETVVTNDAGERVCATCGLVLDHVPFVPEKAHWERTHERNSFRIATVLQSTKEASISKRLQRINNSSGRSRLYDDYLNFVYEMQRTIGFSSNIRKGLVYFLNKELRDRGVNNMYGFLAACLILLARKHGELVTIKDTRKIPRLRRKKASFLLKNMEYIKDKYSLYLKQMDQKQLLNTVLQRIRSVVPIGDVESMEILKSAYDNIDKTRDITGNPIGIAAALLYVVEKTCFSDHYITQDAIYQAVSIQPVTLRRVIKILKKRFSN